MNLRHQNIWCCNSIVRKTESVRLPRQNQKLAALSQQSLERVNYPCESLGKWTFLTKNMNLFRTKSFLLDPSKTQATSFSFGFIWKNFIGFCNFSNFSFDCLMLLICCRFYFCLIYFQVLFQLQGFDRSIFCVIGCCLCSLEHIDTW